MEFSLEFCRNQCRYFGRLYRRKVRGGSASGFPVHTYTVPQSETHQGRNMVVSRNSGAVRVPPEQTLNLGNEQ